MLKIEGHKEMWIEKRAVFYHLKNLFLQGESDKKQLTKIGNDWKCFQVKKESGNKKKRWIEKRSDTRSVAVINLICNLFLTVFLKNFTSLHQIFVQWQFGVFVSECKHPALILYQIHHIILVNLLISFSNNRFRFKSQDLEFTTN